MAKTAPKEPEFAQGRRCGLIDAGMAVGELTALDFPALPSHFPQTLDHRKIWNAAYLAGVEAALAEINKQF